MSNNPVRRVASGQNVLGKSGVVLDELVRGVEIVPGGYMFSLWGADAAPTFPNRGRLPEFREFFPAAGGYRFLLMTIPPNGGAATGKDEFAALSSEEQAQLGGELAHIIEDDEPGMHTTDTVDLEYVVSGEATLEFDDGELLHLKAGEAFVQNGTRHRWSNRGDVPAVVVVVMIGGEPRAHG